MNKYARLTAADADNIRVVLDVAEAASLGELSTRYHPTLAAEFISAPAEVVPGSILSAGEWSHPEPAAPASPEPAPRLLQISPPTFKMLFTPQERLAIRAARSYAGDDEQALTVRAVVEDWYEIIDDPRLSYVDLILSQTQAGIGFLVTAGIITQERCDEILTGVAA